MHPISEQAQATFRRGLAGIREARDLATHAMRGALFETWVLGEMLKHGCNRGEAPELHFWRDAAGHEVDLLVERAGGLRALEIKSGRTIAADWLDGLEHFARLSGTAEGMLIYGGDQTQRRSRAGSEGTGRGVRDRG